jgi:2'-5' RNA ligase
MKRTFIAIKIHPGKEMRNILDYFKQQLSGEKIKWVDPENMHITISFLGDTDEKMIGSISDIIKQTAMDHPPFELVFSGAGVFKNLRDPRVLWIGTEINPVLQNMKISLENELSGFGFEKENREFRPHLTLGRIKWIKNTAILEEAIQQYKDQEIQREYINELIYYESILKPEGPVYLTILNVPLIKKDP